MTEPSAWGSIPLRGVFDFHVHTAPDDRPRWWTYRELATHASAAGMAGFALKNHGHATMEHANELCQAFRDLRVIGGIVLNRSAGGVDPRIVQRALRDGARVVWLPTRDGRAERGNSEHGIALLDARSKPTDHLLEVFNLIAASDAILATGHVTQEEIASIVPVAKEMGVRKILINHPEIPFMQLTIEFQKRLRDEGAFLERCFPRPEMTDGFRQIAKEIRAVGIESTIIATDLGRKDLCNPLDGFRRFLYELSQLGFRDEELRFLSVENPIALLNR